MSGTPNNAATANSNAPRRLGRFQLHELINSGGMADTWLVTDTAGRPYALRMLHERLRYSLVARWRFFRGCKILAKIHNHKSIIGYHEHGKINGRPYLLMEYVEGVNLKLLMARRDPLLAENVAQILIDMARGLEHMHESGFMHLDFKPENVVVTHAGEVRLVDFDLARPIPKKPKRIRKNPGTPAYMAPEQLMGKPIDHRADIFAYGVTAYEILTGQKPFPGAEPAEILQRQLDRAAFAPPRQLNPDVPPALERIILKCLETDPDKRHLFMAVLVHELESALYV
ncbi:MAG: serine/threonine protein kinase [Verrucomicrobiae bacterium]|nr:serine/threonine protein kinase [Verrucomicrobiae bacterium]MDW7980074.1 serine/threonine-protein kinase [Verrucomicrobiales bacterium]